jgi:hypothetical protein
VKDALIRTFIVSLACRPEYLGLHPRAHDPEGIRHHVAEEAADASADRVQLERIVLPAVPLLEVQLRPLIEREVNGVKERDAEY